MQQLPASVRWREREQTPHPSTAAPGAPAPHTAASSRVQQPLLLRFSCTYVRRAGVVMLVQLVEPVRHVETPPAPHYLRTRPPLPSEHAPAVAEAVAERAVPGELEPQSPMWPGASSPAGPAFRRRTSAIPSPGIRSPPSHSPVQGQPCSAWRVSAGTGTAPHRSRCSLTAALRGGPAGAGRVVCQELDASVTTVPSDTMVIKLACYKYR